MYKYLNDRVDINIILPHISKFTYKHELDNVSFNLCSLRLNTFKFKGLDCVCCGRKGTHFRIQRTKNSNENYHIGASYFLKLKNFVILLCLDIEK